MNKPRPTPRPWRLGKPYEGKVKIFHFGGIDDDDETVCCCTEMNAALIIRVMNSHEELLEAAKQAMGYLMVKISGDALRIFNQLEEAIRNADE